MKKLLIALSAITLTLFWFSSLAFAKSVDLKIESPSAILMERDTGKILYNKESDKQLPPASMTKIMTMILIMEQIDKGTLTLNEKVRASERASSMGGSQIFLEEGEEMTVEELLKAVAIASANDASVALAEHIAGTEEEFVKRMNDKVNDLGLKNTHFTNSTGLPAKNHYSSAYDMAMMAKELLKYEEITNYTSIYEDYLRENTDKKFWLVNTNRLVKFYDGVDGLKTGFTNEAKYCLTATAKKNNLRMISVVMGAQNTKERNRDITKMFDYAFSQFEIDNLYARGEMIEELKISKGSKRKVKVITDDVVSILHEKGEDIDNITESVKLKKDLKAPIKKGEPIGTLILKKNGDVLSETTLVSADDIVKASWWMLFKRTLQQLTFR
ncbi:D-alanyl-D-alanine carboxypeptidase family protein [Pueribacillus sp. YX66]|uniref:D-alanyl-D-alanine carboxypeptidase family protein n=1 Tax=Pueribacillus sp. YX66 TaxID=3229242 RepID=UPI0036D20D1E